MDNQVDTSPYKYNTQLHMYRPDVPLPPMQLPEGYILRSARLEDGAQLCHCFRGGYLSIEEESQELFEKNILSAPGASLDRIMVLENADHQIVATATAKYTDDPSLGKIGMVASPVEFRGMGLSKYVCWAAIDLLRKNGRMASTLSTDDFRLGAIKTYLRVGYLPVLYQEDMEARWRDVMEILGYTTLSTVIRANGLYENGPTLTL